MKLLKIAIFGGGNMGLAFARAMLKAAIVKRSDLLVIDRSISRKPFILKELKCSVKEKADKSIENYDLVFLAVKPQDAKILLDKISPFIKPNQFIISLMTGIKLADLSTELNDHNKIVRSMPNLPAHVQKGITVYKSFKKLSFKQKSLVEKVLGSAGITLEVKNESLIDAATAVPGTGPGYFFYFLEYMIAAACKLGFSKEEAELLIKETMRGTLELWQQTNLSPAELRKKVTSKGGTTNAAIRIFDKSGLGDLIIKGMLAADSRARELSDLNSKS
ncbi:MAG: pyrroline-5-carboxylate reductase [bacterium]|nr:pyrroline-5-carboxylate reductase [bacterium]